MKIIILFVLCFILFNNNNNNAINADHDTIYLGVSKLFPTEDFNDGTRGTSGDEFGGSVSMSDDGLSAITSARYDCSAYIWNRRSIYSYDWWVVQKITPNDGGDYFGYSVSMSGDGKSVIIGAPWDSGKGAAYIWKKVSNEWWNEVKKITPNDGAGDFGRSVSMSDDGLSAIIGAPRDDGYKGSVYIWNKINDELMKITAFDGAGDDYFGWSVSMSGDGLSAIIGAPHDDDKGTNSGSVYIWNKINEVIKITNDDGAVGDIFGYSVSMSGDGKSVIIGAPGLQYPRSSNGSAYIWNKTEDEWGYVTKITAYDPAAGDQFGYSVSMSGDGLSAIIGAYGDDDKGTYSGAAYIWNKINDKLRKITPNDGAAWDEFGSSVSMSGDGSSAIIGAPFDDEKGPSSGSAYVYETENIAPNAVCQNVVKVADASCSASIVANEVDNGSTDADGDSLSFSVTGLTSFSGTGSRNVLLTVSDGRFFVTCSATVTVHDQSAPVITCPSNTTLGYTESTSFSNTGEASATDNCDNDVTITPNDVVSGDDDDTPNDYIITRTWSAVDDDNNESQCVQTISVQEDNNSTNEIQTLSQNGNTITLSDGGSVTIDVNDADNNSSNELQTLSQDSNTITLSDGGGSVTIDVNDADNNSSNELQTLSLNSVDNTITLSDDGGTISIADNDNSATNELQTLSLNSVDNTITLSDDGGTISIADNDNSATNELQTLSLNSVDNTITLSDDGGTISIADNDNSATNELQSLSSSASGTIRTINIRDGSGTNIDVADNDNSATNEIQTLTVTKGQGNEYTFEFDKGNVIIDNTNNDKSLKSNDQQNGTLDFDTIVNQVIQQSTIVQNQITNVMTTSIEENTIIQNQITNVIQNSENTALFKQLFQCLIDNNGKNKAKECADLLSQVTSDDTNNSEASALSSPSATSSLSTMTIAIAVVACAAMCLLTAIFVVMKVQRLLKNFSETNNNMASIQMKHNDNNNSNTIEMITRQ